MINNMVLERVVVKGWKYADDPLFRLACYRDPDLPTRLLYDTRSSLIDRKKHLRPVYWKKKIWH